jgi:hypothetical protein
MTTLPRPLEIVPLKNRPAWKALEEHYTTVRDLQLRQVFAGDPQRASTFTLEALAARGESGLFSGCTKIVSGG